MARFIRPLPTQVQTSVWNFASVTLTAFVLLVPTKVAPNRYQTIDFSANTIQSSMDLPSAVVERGTQGAHYVYRASIAERFSRRHPFGFMFI